MKKKGKQYFNNSLYVPPITGYRMIHCRGKPKPRHQRSKSHCELFEALECNNIKEISLLTSVGTYVINSLQNVTHYKKKINAPIPNERDVPSRLFTCSFHAVGLRAYPTNPCHAK